MTPYSSRAVALLDVPPRANGAKLREVHVAARARGHLSVLLLRAWRRRAFDARALLTVCLRRRGIAAAAHAATAAEPIARTVEGGVGGRGHVRAGRARAGRHPTGQQHSEICHKQPQYATNIIANMHIDIYSIEEAGEVGGESGEAGY